MRSIMAPRDPAADAGELVEGLAGALKDCAALCVGLPSPYSDVDVKGIDLKAISTSTDSLAGHDRGAGAHEQIEHDVTTSGTVAHRVGNKGDRLDRGMHCQVIQTSSPEGVHVWV